jgi:Rps23 Pro-64 3,4-dihydroxylase Tpa1-like proline 4-hydroxylase
MEIHQARVGYHRKIHLDHRRRLLTMLIYFCDHEENRMQGGELLLHNGPEQPWYPGRATSIAPCPNLMLAFPSSRSFHSVAPITSQAAPRNYLQVHISSSVDIWDEG